LVSLRAEFTFSPLCFVVGMDAFLGLPTWHRWRDLFELAHLVVLTRPGREPLISQDLRSEMERRHTEDVTDLHTALHGRIMFLRVTQLEISSTAIREALGKGRSVRFLLPDGVYDYIRQCDLYRLTPSLMA
jgi:nicotinate-nucleotide adenylyltransferase